MKECSQYKIKRLKMAENCVIWDGEDVPANYVAGIDHYAQTGELIWRRPEAWTFRREENQQQQRPDYQYWTRVEGIRIWENIWGNEIVRERGISLVERMRPYQIADNIARSRLGEYLGVGEATEIRSETQGQPLRWRSYEDLARDDSSELMGMDRRRLGQITDYPLTPQEAEHRSMTTGQMVRYPRYGDLSMDIIESAIGDMFYGRKKRKNTKLNNMLRRLRGKC